MSNQPDLLTAAKVALEVMREYTDSDKWDVFATMDNLVEAMNNLAEAIEREEKHRDSLSSWGNPDLRAEAEEHSREEEGGRE